MRRLAATGLTAAGILATGLPVMPAAQAAPAAGIPIYGGPYRCAIGANVIDGSGGHYFITAGHCGDVVDTWYSDAAEKTVIGTTQASSFPTDDFSIARYADGITPDPGLTSAGNAYVGEHVCMRGPASGLHCGTVLALNATVTYAEGTVGGLVDTNLCGEVGDGGAPVFDGSTILGILSGSNGDCSSGGESFFQPITEVLSAYGVSLY
jgi:streptogrisin B